MMRGFVQRKKVTKETMSGYVTGIILKCWWTNQNTKSSDQTKKANVQDKGSLMYKISDTFHIAIEGVDPKDHNLEDFKNNGQHSLSKTQCMYPERF